MKTHYYLLLLTLVFHFTRTSADFILTYHKYNTVTLFCQLISTKESFISIIPSITWGDSDQTFEFIDIRDQLNDSRYLGTHFPDHKAKNLVGQIVIRDFRESDLQNNFKCTQSLINGTNVEYALTIANDTAIIPTANCTNTTTHSYSGNTTRGITNATHHATHMPPCIQNSFPIEVCSVLIILVVTITTACFSLPFLAVFVFPRIKIKEKFSTLKRRLQSIVKCRQTNVRVVYHVPSDTVDVATDSDSHSASSSAQEFHSIQAEDLSEPAILDNEYSIEPPVKGLIKL